MKKVLASSLIALLSLPSWPGGRTRRFDAEGEAGSGTYEAGSDED